MNDLLRRILEDDSLPVHTLEELEEEYDAEMSKPSEERDYDLIGEIDLTIMDRMGIKPPDKEETWKKMQAKILDYERKKRSRKKMIAIAACVAFMIIVPINFASQKVYGMNVLSAFVEIISGRMHFDYTKNDIAIEIPTSADDPYGLKAECGKYGIEVLLPSYIPKNLKLIHLDFEETFEIKTANFTYKISNQKLNIFMCQYINDIPESFQSSADGRFEEVNINGKLASIVEDGKEYRVTFNYEDTIYRIDTQNIDYGELIGVLYSFQ